MSAKQALFTVCAFIFLRHHAIAQQQAILAKTKIEKQRSEWEPWGSWSMCSTTAGMGVRVRSRLCAGNSCNHLAGDNYQLEQCNRKGGDFKHQKPEYISQCNNDPNMRGTLSCKLYRENPTMAYDIFQSTGTEDCSESHHQMSCLFDVIGDQSKETDTSNSQAPDNLNLVFGKAPNREAGERSLAFQGQLDISSLSSGRFTETDISSRTSPSVPSSTDSPRLTTHLCTSACEAVVLQATRISRFGSNLPTTVTEVLQLLSTSDVFRGNIKAIADEYERCFQTCRITGPSYGALRLNILNSGDNRALHNPDLEISLASTIKQEKQRKRLRRSIQVVRRRPVEPKIVKKKAKKTNSTLRVRGLNFSADSREGRLILVDLINAARPQNGHGANRIEQMRLLGILNRATQRRRPHQTHIRARLYEGPYKKSARRPKPTATMPPTERPSPTDEGEEQHSNEGTLSRKKRQLYFPQPNNYKSPCFVQETLSTNPRVLTTDDNEGELFFYEGKQQKFLRKRCTGRSIFPQALFQAAEQVTQARTGQLALCKQGYLQRYGLLIQLDPEGAFSFNDGQRFSVRFKPFKLESHCSLSTLQ